MGRKVAYRVEARPRGRLLCLPAAHKLFRGQRTPFPQTLHILKSATSARSLHCKGSKIRGLRDQMMRNDQPIKPHLSSPSSSPPSPERKQQRNDRSTSCSANRPNDPLEHPLLILLPPPRLRVTNVRPERDHVVERTPSADNAAWVATCQRRGEQGGGDFGSGRWREECREQNVQSTTKEVHGRKNVRLHLVAVR